MDPGIPTGISSRQKSTTTKSKTVSTRRDRYTTSVGLGDSTIVDLPTQSTKTAYNGASSTDETVTSSSSTFYTSPTAQSQAANVTGSPTQSALPATSHSNGSGISSGALAAAIVVPILALIVLLLGFLCLRRRSRDPRQRTDSGGSSFLPVLKEKWGSLRSSDSSAQAAREMDQMDQMASGPVVTGTQNNAYFTGLDTSSTGGSSPRTGGNSGDFAHGRRSEGGTTFVVPPPPYNATPANTTVPSLPQLQQSPRMEFDVGQFVSTFPTPPQTSHGREPVSPISAVLGDGPPTRLAVPGDPPQSSSRSARSITSTLYSDTASVHSARAARMSVGPNVVSPAAAARLAASSGLLSATDPFDDPNTPITPLSAQEAEHRQLE